MNKKVEKYWSQFKSYRRKVKRAKRIKKYRDKIAPYLKKDFGVELNYKLWITKGARFKASERTNIADNLSSQTIGYLSAYLIIFNLVNIYDISFIVKFTNDQLGFISTALSILILLYSQFENAKKHSIKSEKFHQCSLEIAELYNELRMVKTFENVYNREDKIKRISERYDEILKKYENHLPIDLADFRGTKPKYFELNWFEINWIRVKKYFLVKFKYHLMIYGPILTYTGYQVWKKSCG
ncbi:SLATT domain-containing protein [Winogradskyella sp. SM1960]|uniref:SLATT domain-containing protein n=1 Tax=Winogradskyella sp. SM1960 TaxID=2865955 RepID=UPI001CD4139F|nr:SLATT domain-containing protein [Winogradskyella sp. SM1960]